jgi:mono/diheme cytochrome c family protein
MRALFVTLRVLLFTAGVILLIGAALARQSPTPISRAAASVSTAPASRMASSTASNSVSVATTDTGASTSTTKSLGAKVSSPNVEENAADLLLEGEKRFATNCGRCHQSPHHFPPRMMATIVRHMRVRATITDEDMRLILRYMTQ